MNTNIYNPYVRQELELYHHGILGQRWGKKNGPPYPLSASDHSASEKKAGWRKSLLVGGDIKVYSRKNEKDLDTLSNNKDRGFKINDRLKKKLDNSEQLNKIRRDRAAEVKKVDETYGAAVKEIYRKSKAERDKIVEQMNDEYDRGEKSIKQIADIYEPKLASIEKKYGSRKAQSAYTKAREAVDKKYENAIVETALKELKIPVTDENKRKIKNTAIIDTEYDPGFKDIGKRKYK